MIERIVCDDAAQLAEAAAARIAFILAAAVRQRGFATIALAGGKTPEPIYERLAGRSDMPWRAMRWYWGDERAVPPDHPAANYRMAMASALGRVALDHARVYRMLGEADDLAAAAAAYEQTLRATLGPAARGVTFDLLLLGMGDDGHTASLFPAAPELAVHDRWVAATEQAHAGYRRLTLTYPAINAAREVIILVAGANKAAALRRAFADNADILATPVAGVTPRSGRLAWLADRAALAELDQRDWTPAADAPV